MRRSASKQMNTPGRRTAPGCFSWLPQPHMMTTAQDPAGHRRVPGVNQKRPDRTNDALRPGASSTKGFAL